MDLTTSPFGLAAVGVFVVAYACVVFEERLRLRKSVPVTIAAGLVWMLTAAAFHAAGKGALAGELLRHTLLEYGELLLFLLSAITFVNTMEERQVFDVLRSRLIRQGLSLRALFWVTGGLAFCISPFADNLTTALVLGAVALSVGSGNARFVTPACINVVVAANAGGAFSPFGDITTLMVWQKGIVPFAGFFALFVPALVTWLVPATILSATLGREMPQAQAQSIGLRPGARRVVALFVLTIVGTVLLHQFWHLPPALGMMTGLGCLKLLGHFLARGQGPAADPGGDLLSGIPYHPDPEDRFDIFRILERMEWDTLMFFYGVLVCVGGLGALGYLSALSHGMYGGPLGPTGANVLVGLLSALVDNIPVMYAVLTMQPAMGRSQWLLVTLTAGVGGSLLSVGSAAGVALMGQARGVYTFGSHLRWSWAVALGYAAGVATHLLINGR